jgi:hypothetical protein
MTERKGGRPRKIFSVMNNNLDKSEKAMAQTFSGMTEHEFEDKWDECTEYERNRLSRDSFEFQRRLLVRQCLKYSRHVLKGIHHHTRDLDKATLNDLIKLFSSLVKAVDTLTARIYEGSQKDLSALPDEELEKAVGVEENAN